MKVAQCRTAIFAIMSGGRCPPMDLMASTTASQQDRLRKLVQPWPRHKRFSTGRRLARKTCQCEGPWSGLALRLRRRCSNSHDWRIRDASTETRIAQCGDLNELQPVAHRPTLRDRHAGALAAPSAAGA